MRCIEFLRLFFFRIPNFRIGIPICRFFNSGIREKFSTGIFGIKNGIGIPLPMGVPEIETENWNFQPCSPVRSVFRDPFSVFSKASTSTCHQKGRSTSVKPHSLLTKKPKQDFGQYFVNSSLNPTILVSYHIVVTLMMKT
jgi:hypothetical protein